MKITASHDKPKGKNWLKRNYLSILIFTLVAAITISVFLFRKEVVEFESYGYLGAFLISLTSNATIVLPVPGIVILFALGAVLPSATLVGLVSGIGAALGEITGYMAGHSGRAIAQRSRLYARLVVWVRRWGTLTIFTFTLIPFFPFDLAGVASGALRFPFWKFFLVCWAGRTILYTGIAWAGAKGWETLLPLLMPYLG